MLNKKVEVEPCSLGLDYKKEEVLPVTHALSPHSPSEERMYRSQVHVGHDPT